ncbi:hypothetical protein KIPB_002831 [Kipferlia bialata]|uniref:Uncharacterized protein n=1 Tax=Kipferlia bialata TaxID=797122 RepID=A0A391NSP7_9EUKA|nr:hypothetical protein KIPB_002831 [Kipferlia bialata]|eukprot:g2831.t1
MSEGEGLVEGLLAYMDASVIQGEIVPTLITAALSACVAIVILTDKNMRSSLYFPAVAFGTHTCTAI